MSRLVVTGAGTEIGKTYVTCAIIAALRARGRAVEALKPIVSGFDELDAGASDPALLLKALGRETGAAQIAHIAPWRFRAPLAANMAARQEGRRLAFADVANLCAARAGEPLLIEGAGGVMSPLDDTHTFLDLIAALGAPCVLVSGTYLGAISHTLSALAALQARVGAPLCVIVNESAGPAAPPLGETLNTFRALAPDAVFGAVTRGGNLPVEIADLIADSV